MKNNKGFSLVELVFAMAIFIIIMVGTSATFDNLLGKTAQQAKTAETGIEGIIGLELLRADMDRAGFGLPWSFATPINYLEADLAIDYPVIGVDSNSFNDSGSPGKPPRAIMSAVVGVGGTFAGSDYLVIKSSSVGMNKTAKKSIFINYTSITNTQIASDERVVVIKPIYPSLTIPNSADNRQLIVSPAGGFYFTGSTIPTGTSIETFIAYGINSPDDAYSGSTLRMPFNRADYFVKRPAEDKMPQGCNKKTGILYKATINQSNGGMTFYPLLDCVADFQVAYNLDTNLDGVADLHSNDPPADPTDQAAAIRSQVKEVLVYVLAQEGKKDTSYKYPSPIIEVGETINSVQLGRKFDLANLQSTGDSWENYRWRVYKLVIHTQNLFYR